MAMDRDGIANVVRQIRERHGWSQMDLALRMQMSPSQISRHERGQAMSTATAEEYVRASGDAMLLTPEGWRLHEPTTTAYRTFGRVPCGYGIDVSPATWDEAETIDLGELTGGRYDPDRHFLMQADGQSMEGAGIQDGDWLVAEWKVHARPNDIVVATLNDTTTVKRLVVDAATDVWKLAPASERYTPRELTEYDEVMIQGVVIGRLRFTELR